MVVVQHGELEMGLLTDEILGMVDVPQGALAAAGAAAGALAARYVRAVLPDGLILLDLRALVDDDRLVVDEEVQ
jgi:chemotaxis signal transduction protein